MPHFTLPYHKTSYPSMTMLSIPPSEGERENPIMVWVFIIASFDVYHNHVPQSGDVQTPTRELSF